MRVADPKPLRQAFSVTIERVIAELNGQACIDLTEVAPAKQQIMSSRSFGAYVQSLAELEQAVASYVAIAAEKLRKQDSLAGVVQVFIRTNPHKRAAPQYQPTLSVPLPTPSADTLRLTAAALWGLKRIYRPGFEYQKAGVVLCELSRAATGQFSLLDSRQDKPELMAVLDKINALWGRGTMKLGVEGVDNTWSMRRENLSPRYTSSWLELPVAMAE